MIKIIASAQEVPKDLSFDGWIWLSDKTEPLKDRDPAHWLSSKNPYLLEGHWKATNGQNDVFLTARGTGTHVFMNLIMLKDVPPIKITSQSFIPHSSLKIPEAEAITLWESFDQEACNGFPVLQPTLTFIQFP
jgi:CRISPR type III-associated protein (TIGR04423 family)